MSPSRAGFVDQLRGKSLQPTNHLRLSRAFLFGERWRMSLIGEVFNLFNIASLSGRSGNLLAPGFGQPTSRFTQVFGSGGPRSVGSAGQFLTKTFCKHWTPNYTTR